MNEILHEYLELMTNPAHIFVEISNIIIVDVLIGLIVWPLIKKLLTRTVIVHEESHGISHDTPKEKPFIPESKNRGHKFDGPLTKENLPRLPDGPAPGALLKSVAAPPTAHGAPKPALPPTGESGVSKGLDGRR